MTKKSPVNCYTGAVEWYTPPEIIAAARAVLGEIDLDPASSSAANKIVRAQKFYTVDDNGLAQNWYGRIWINPPYSREIIGRFVDKLLASNFDAAIVLTNAATDSRWFRKLADNASAIIFSTGRIRFYKPDATRGGSPACGQAFSYFGDNPQKFISEFEHFGWIAKGALK